jgi:hypothetical protein
MMKCLFLYDEFGKDMGLPSMKDSFMKEPYEGQEDVVSYLKNGKKTYARTETPKDVFTGETIPVESYGMTDGEYSWNSVLPYYVEKYNLKLPKEFEEKVLNK